MPRIPSLLHALSTVLALLSLVGCPTLARSAQGGNLEQQIAGVSEQLKAEPDHVALRLKRGRLLMEAEAWKAAGEDFRHVLKVEPEQHSARYFLADIALREGRLEPALQAVDAFVQAVGPKKRGSLFRGALLKGEILQALGRHNDSAAEYGRALTLASRPQPEHVLAHAEALTLAERPLDAVTALDAGIERLGPLPDLELRAIAVLKELGRLDLALKRLDRLTKGSRDLLLWRVEQGDLYLQMNEAAKAAIAYRAALDAWRQLPKGRQGISAMLGLKERAEDGLRTAAESSSVD